MLSWSVMVILILVLLGLCLGSFVNALVWRLHKQEEREEIERQPWSLRTFVPKLLLLLRKSDDKYSIATGRSMCTHCGHGLAAKDLVPVASYLWLRGKCRYCRKPIQDTPMAELVTPLVFVISYIFWPTEFTGAGLFTFVLWLVFLVGFVALSLYDLKWFLLPDRVVFPLIGLAIIQVLIVATLFGGGWSVILEAFWGVAIGSGIFYLLHLVSGGTWIGLGDVKLGVVLGLLVGGPANAFMVIFVASLLGTLIALPLLLTGRATRTSHLPFGPFLMAATFIVVIFGGQLIDWYTGALIGS